MKLIPMTISPGDVRVFCPGLVLHNANQPDEYLVVHRIDSATQTLYVQRVTLPARRHWLFRMLRRLFR